MMRPTWREAGHKGKEVEEEQIEGKSWVVNRHRVIFTRLSMCDG